MIYTGDCVEVMAGMEPESVDAIVTDPPYNLNFMGKHWDKNLNHGPWAAEAFRVAKPGAYLLAFGGTRTFHRLAVAIEDAGWIIRDTLVWGYASGFPKGRANLKPAWEPIVMARKPGPLRPLAIDECRIGLDGGTTRSHNEGDYNSGGWRTGHEIVDLPAGRWPANIVLTDPIFDGGVDGVVGGGVVSGGIERDAMTATTHDAPARFGYSDDRHQFAYGDSGTYSRFFLIPKADRADREPLLRGQLEKRSEQDGTVVRNARCLTCGKVKWAAEANRCQCAEPKFVPSSTRENLHPTVKPTELMRHLVRLVTPVTVTLPDGKVTPGTVLDPFLGSGTTAIAAEQEGFAWIGIEKEAEYVAIAEARLNGVQRGLGLDVPAPTRKPPKTHPDLAKHQPKRRAAGDNYSGGWAGTEDDAA